MNINAPRLLPSAGIVRARRRIENDFVKVRLEEPQLTRLALNEAEAVAWLTGWPDLVFPTLAEEKLRALSAWHRGQKAMRKISSASN